MSGAGIVATSYADGGAEEYLRQLYAGLAERGIRGHLLGDLPRWDSTGLPQTSLALGPKWSVRTLPPALARLPLERRRVLRAARRLVARGEIFAFHMQFKREQVALTAALSRLAPVVWTEHGVLPDHGLRSAIVRPYRAAARHASAIVCVSDAVRDQLESLLAPPRPRFVLIPNGIDLDRFRPPSPAEKAAVRAGYGIEPEALVVGSVGRLDPGKNLDLSIAAAERLPDVTLLIAGTGSDEARLRRTAGSKVRFLGQIEDVSHVYRALDALLFTSSGVGEGLPLAILEAAASGVPTVTVEGSRAERLVEELGGSVVPRDPAAVATSIPQMRHRRVNREVVASRYGREQWLEAHLALLQEVEVVG